MATKGFVLRQNSDADTQMSLIGAFTELALSTSLAKPAIKLKDTRKSLDIAPASLALVTLFSKCSQ